MVNQVRVLHLLFIFHAYISRMMDVSHKGNQIHRVTNFHDLVSTPFHSEINAICWTRQLKGDFSEIVKEIESNENIVTIEPHRLLDLQLSEEGQLAREIILNDFKLLTDHGASIPFTNAVNHSS
jgi:hypothetical protein